MNRNVSQQPQQLLDWMGGLSDATRLRLLVLAEGQELSVAELCEVLQMPQSTVSRHLKVLGDQGWVHYRRQGTARLYRLLEEELESSQRELWKLARGQAKLWPELAQDRLRLEEHLARRGDDPRTFFAGAAARWDDLRSECYGETFAIAALASLLPRDWTVVDLGCGTGHLATLMARQVKRVIGVDQSEEMLAAARRRSTGFSNLEWRQGDLRRLPLDDAVSDAALMLLALTYLADPAAALAEARRVVRPGGKVVLVDLLSHDREDFRLAMGQRSTGFEVDEIKALLAGAGLHELVAFPLTPEVRAKGPALLLASGTV